MSQAETSKTDHFFTGLVYTALPLSVPGQFQGLYEQVATKQLMIPQLVFEEADISVELSISLHNLKCPSQEKSVALLLVELPAHKRRSRPSSTPSS